VSRPPLRLSVGDLDRSGVSVFSPRAPAATLPCCLVFPRSRLVTFLRYSPVSKLPAFAYITDPLGVLTAPFVYGRPPFLKQLVKTGFSGAVYFLPKVPGNGFFYFFSLPSDLKNKVVFGHFFPGTPTHLPPIFVFLLIPPL